MTISPFQYIISNNLFDYTAKKPRVFLHHNLNEKIAKRLFEIL